MKTPILLLIVAAFTFGARVHSQNAAAPKTPLQQLQEMRAKNQLLLEKQTATLVRLDELHKQAAQLRFFTKRS